MSHGFLQKNICFTENHAFFVGVFEIKNDDQLSVFLILKRVALLCIMTQGDLMVGH